jgi:hypothetical protein
VDWYPFDAAEDPVQATASLTMTREEYDLAVLQVQGLLHYVLGFCPAP